MKKKEEKKPLFRVFLKSNDRPAYLPSEGLLDAEANRMSDGLLAETYIKKIYDPESEESDE